MRAASVNGFTLPEMLVSLAILGLMSSMMLAGLQAAGSLSQRTLGRSSDVEAVATAQFLMRDKLERMAAVVRFDGSGTNVDARGNQFTFSFMAPPVDRLAPGTLQRYRIALSTGGDLMLYSSDSLDVKLNREDSSLIGWKHTRMIRNVGSLSIAYFGPDRLLGERRWQAKWSDRPQPPDAIRIRIGFGQGDPRVWPDLIVHPCATVNSVCKIDQNSGLCVNVT